MTACRPATVCWTSSTVTTVSMYELTDGVLHDEVPADDEGAELADSDVAVDVG